MNKIEITKEIFEKHCYSATHCNNNVFEAVEPRLALAQDELFRALALDAVDNPTPSEMTLITGVICVKAYADSIPHLDLILTDSGFGVVSTENIAPASKERVERLAKKLLDVYDDAIDALIGLLRSHTEWSDTDVAKGLFCTFFWSGEYFRRFAFPGIYRRECAKYQPLVSIAEAKIRHIVGDELIDELLTGIRHNDISSLQTQAISIIHSIISAEITDTHTADVQQLVLTMLRFLDTHIEDFPKYRNSSAYAARKSDKFENHKNNTAFFWC